MIDTERGKRERVKKKVGSGERERETESKKESWRVCKNKLK